jgi:FMN phosphatase YigB (HAD superfamily)
VLFDLFGTLIRVEAERLPVMEIAGRPVRTTVGGLGAVLAQWAPGVSPAAFVEELRSVSEEMARARADDHVELPSRVRFGRVLARLGCPAEHRAEGALHLARAHLALIAGATVLPPAHARLLASLAGRLRMGVVTNFDDTATAYDILHAHGLLGFLRTVVVSESVGLRKPHPALVRVALHGLGLDASSVLLVGDTLGEDVAAAGAAGVDAAWIDARGEGIPAHAPAPRFVLTELCDVGRILATG